MKHMLMHYAPDITVGSTNVTAPCASLVGGTFGFDKLFIDTDQMGARPPRG